jgi:hypothetical protein
MRNKSTGKIMSKHLLGDLGLQAQNCNYKLRGSHFNNAYISDDLSCLCQAKPLQYKKMNLKKKKINETT